MHKHSLIVVLMVIVAVVSRADIASAVEPSASRLSADSGRKDGEPPAITITLPGIIREAVRNNPSVINDYLQAKIARETVAAERSIYEPVLQSSLNSQTNKIQNSTEETLVKGSSTYEELNNQFDLGLTGLVPTGAQWDIRFVNGMTNSSTIEQFRDYNNEYTGNLKLTLTQPLLKGRGRSATEARINVAAIQSDVDFGKFEQRMMELIGVTIQVYWRLYGAQQISQAWESSLKIAEESIDDLELRYSGGKVAETELLEARSGIHQRRTELINAQSKVVEAKSQLFTLLNLQYAQWSTVKLYAPELSSQTRSSLRDVDYFVARAKEAWPEYKNARRLVEKERTQVAYADNQSLPQLDFLGSVGTNSLDRKYPGSFDHMVDDKFLSWSVGIKFSMPLFGEGQGKSALAIARLRLQQAENDLNALEKSLANTIHAKHDAVKSFEAQLAEYESGLEIRKKLLDIEREKLKAGRVGQRSLLLQEEEYVNLQRRLYSSLVNYKVAEAVLEIACGEILGKYDVDPASYSYQPNAGGSDAPPMLGN